MLLWVDLPNILMYILKLNTCLICVYCLQPLVEQLGAGAEAGGVAEVEEGTDQHPVWAEQTLQHASAAHSRLCSSSSNDVQANRYRPLQAVA